jgi:peptidoglycan/xylan/chitin deacetylase (PgdA/CDA1 family)
VSPPVLCYHRIGGPLELGVTRVARSAFVRQMTSLAKAGWTTLTLRQFADYCAGNSAFRIPPSVFLLTFDDGYTELGEHAYPVLADLGFTATTFLVTDYVGRENTWDVRYTWRRLTHLDWDTIEIWRARGFEFGSHSATHRRLTWLPEAAVTEELARSRETLTARFGAEAGRALAYPFGATNPRVIALARQAGYALGFGGVHGGAEDPLQQPRVPVYMWDAGRIPFGLQNGLLGELGRGVAHAANRCAVGTSLMLRLFRS